MIVYSYVARWKSDTVIFWPFYDFFLTLLFFRNVIFDRVTINSATRKKFEVIILYRNIYLISYIIYKNIFVINAPDWI